MGYIMLCSEIIDLDTEMEDLLGGFARQYEVEGILNKYHFKFHSSVRLVEDINETELIATNRKNLNPNIRNSF